MPALTISTDKATPSRPRTRSNSPVPPPMSPITPPLGPTQQPPGAEAEADAAAAEAPTSTLPRPRHPLTHSSQPSHQTGIPPPPPEPIDFDSNPDVIALKSAISVLQVQKGRATRDIQALSTIRDEALADPEAFIRDLAAGKVKPTSDDFAFGAHHDDDDDEDDDEDDKGGGGKNNDEPPLRGRASKPRPWSALPKPQAVVRCPPINWAQYAVVGDSLDKLHAEQVSRPSQGAPAVFRPSGLYELKTEGKQETYNGVAAPYDPARDAIDRKAKSKAGRAG
ncbi:hypothetical protein E4U41_003472 [Claviceps citrina]|nr:hypothetical protein E4U41_003472 [Claviceps citrina]